MKAPPGSDGAAHPAGPIAGAGCGCDSAISASLVVSGLEGVTHSGRGVWARERLVYVQTGEEETEHHLLFGTLADGTCDSWNDAPEPIAGQSLFEMILWDARDDRDEAENHIGVEPVSGTYGPLGPDVVGWAFSGFAVPDGEYTSYESGEGTLELHQRADRIDFTLSGVGVTSRGPGNGGRLGGSGVFCGCDVERTIDPPDTVID